MDNTLLIGLSRQTTLRRELDIVANNIASINTTGFKADGAVFSEYLQTNARAEQCTAPDRRLSFVQDRMSWHDMSQGTVQQTGNPLDIALDGDAMLVVQTPRGERYTRNGSLQIGATGELVTSAGDKVMGDNGPIVFQTTDRDIEITKDGTIKVREGVNLTSDSTRGKLRLVTFANPQQLQKDGASTFRAPDGLLPEPTTKTKVVQGAIEKSNVRSVVEMTQMIEVLRNYQSTQRLLETNHDLQRRAIDKIMRT